MQKIYITTIKHQCCSSHFYPRGASDARVYFSRRRVSVCLRVWLSVKRRYSFETAKRRITQTTPRDSPGTLVL